MDGLGATASGRFEKRFYTPGGVVRDLWDAVVHAHEIRAATGSDRVDDAFAKRILLTVTGVNGCRYCSYAHARTALQAGVGADEVEWLLDGKLEHVPPEEAPALFFAQHYAEQDGQVDPEMRQKLVDRYREEGARDILSYIRMITIGNLSGNTLDALLSRLKGRPAPGSSFGSELLALLLLFVLFPLVAVGSMVEIGCQAIVSRWR